MLTPAIKLREQAETALGMYEHAQRLGQPLDRLVDRLLEIKKACTIIRHRSNAARILSISGDLWLGKGWGTRWQPLTGCTDAQLYEFEINCALAL